KKNGQPYKSKYEAARAFSSTEEQARVLMNKISNYGRAYELSCETRFKIVKLGRLTRGEKNMGNNNGSNGNSGGNPNWPSTTGNPSGGGRGNAPAGGGKGGGGGGNGGGGKGK
ncbi:MAG TPA: hypothetical protein VGL86_32875, partial [Polyangia bacterium]